MRRASSLPFIQLCRVISLFLISSLLFSPLLHTLPSIFAFFDLEYLHLSPIRTQYASEFGHLLRVLMIYAAAENALDYLTGLRGSNFSLTHSDKC